MFILSESLFVLTDRCLEVPILTFGGVTVYPIVRWREVISGWDECVGLCLTYLTVLIVSFTAPVVQCQTSGTPVTLGEWILRKVVAGQMFRWIKQSSPDHAELVKVWLFGLGGH